MHRFPPLLFAAVLPTAACVAAEPSSPAADERVAVRGIVFADLDRDGRQDDDEPGLPGVGVSDGERIVETDDGGRFRLEAPRDALVFVLAPRGFARPVDDRGIPRFWSPATGAPADLAFPLVPRDLPERFDVLLFGDPQVRDATDLGYFRRDVVEPLLGTRAAFAVGLGDIAYDDPAVYDPLTAIMARLGMPFVFLPGNHDIDDDALDDRRALITWRRTFGPEMHAFDVGEAHFLVLDDVIYPAPEGPRDYVGGLRDDQWRFVEADLARTPRERLVVVLMHIPLADMRTADRRRLFHLLAPFPHRLVVAGHWHIQRHFFWTREHGFPSDDPLHELVAPTASGSWWRGTLDEHGIPHATMRDGSPNGVTRLTIDGTSYRLRFLPARRPESAQLHVVLPERVPARRLGRQEVLANVYAGSERSRVTMSIDDGPEVVMRHVEGRVDPLYAALVERDADTAPRHRRLPKPVASPHIWRALLPDDLQPGSHVLEVRSVDMFGQRDTARVIFVVEPR